MGRNFVQCNAGRPDCESAVIGRDACDTKGSSVVNAWHARAAHASLAECFVAGLSARGCA